MKNQYTIKMPKRYLKKWVEALTCGEFIQTRKGVLFDEKSGGFCCLGLLQYAIDGKKVEVDGDRDTGQEFSSFPSMDWLIKKGITFKSKDTSILRDPYLPTLDVTAADANDNGRKFSTIARAIMECTETY